MKSLINWTVFILSLVAGYFCAPWIMRIHLPLMSGTHVLLFALSLAFTWVEVLRWGVTKPFSCMKCMTGWFAVILAFSFHTPFWPLYLFAGLLLGAIFELLKQKL